MSGPKISDYTLTPEQRRILEEQRRVRAELELLEKYISDARSILVEADRVIETLQPLCLGQEDQTLQQTIQLRQTAAQLFSQAAAAGADQSAAQLKQLNQQLRTAARQLSKASVAAKAEHGTLKQAFDGAVAKKLDEGFRFRFDRLGEGKPDPLAVSVLEQLEALAGLELSDQLRAKLTAVKAQLAQIEDPGFLKNFQAMTVAPFVKECRAYDAAYTRWGEAYERKRFLYERNARQLGIRPEQIPFSQEAIALLDAKLKETGEQLHCQQEQAYIRRCMDEAMQELGYTLAGSREVVRRNGQKYRNELYLFDEGTAVSVVYAGDGQITMELGGIAMEDRLPTEQEEASLVGDMRSFCDDYSQLEKLLQSKGVVTKKIRLLPPDRQYATIINASDYSLQTQVSEYAPKKSKKRTAADKSKRTGE